MHYREKIVTELEREAQSKLTSDNSSVEGATSEDGEAVIQRELVSDGYQEFLGEIKQRHKSIRTSSPISRDHRHVRRE
jgi:hypothetical protein